MHREESGAGLGRGRSRRRRSHSPPAEPVVGLSARAGRLLDCPTPAGVSLLPGRGSPATRPGRWRHRGAARGRLRGRAGSRSVRRRGGPSRPRERRACHGRPLEGPEAPRARSPRRRGAAARRPPGRGRWIQDALASEGSRCMGSSLDRRAAGVRNIKGACAALSGPDRRRVSSYISHLQQLFWPAWMRRTTSASGSTGGLSGTRFATGSARRCEPTQVAIVLPESSTFAERSLRSRLG